MINIQEQSDLLTVNVEGKITPKTHSYYTNVVQPKIDSGDYVLVPYSGSTLELQAAKEAKQAEIAAHFRSLHGVSLAQVEENEVAPQPALTYSANTITNAGKAAVSIVFVDGLLDVATVQSYDETTAPGWL